MSVLIRNPGFHYGLKPLKPKLPAGWEYYQDATTWLLAKSPDGKWWFAGGPTLIRCKFATVWDVIRTFPNRFRRWGRGFHYGDRYADTKETYTLPESHPK